MLFDREDTSAAAASAAAAGRSEPACFADLNLDQVLGWMLGGREDYELEPFFYAPLRDAAAVAYRHAVFRDLEQDDVLTVVTQFAERMRAMRAHLRQAAELHYEQQRQRWFLDAAAIYCDAVRAFAIGLERLELGSRAFSTLRKHVTCYMGASGFTALAEQTRAVREGLAAVHYSVHIKGDRVRVSSYDDEPDYTTDVERAFAIFQQGAVKDYRVAFSPGLQMNHVEARILSLVARLHPEQFEALAGFCARWTDFIDPTIARADRELQFYLAYLDLIRPLKKAGLAFCYPDVAGAPGEVDVVGAFDLALATKLVNARTTVVCNDVKLSPPEHVLVVTGPNQGGKTTFARMFGQLPYLASLGVPVPGRRARLAPPDEVFTHFERTEDITTLRGRLKDELVRVREILERATSRSVLVMNEGFTSTTLDDASFLGTHVIRQIAGLGLRCVYVTFVDELTSLGDAVVSVVATVAEDNPDERTYVVRRQPADGRAYAAAVANKHGLSYEALKGRIVG